MNWPICESRSEGRQFDAVSHSDSSVADNTFSERGVMLGALWHLSVQVFSIDLSI